MGQYMMQFGQVQASIAIRTVMVFLLVRVRRHMNFDLTASTVVGAGRSITFAIQPNQYVLQRVL